MQISKHRQVGHLMARNSLRMEGQKQGSDERANMTNSTSRGPSTPSWSTINSTSSKPPARGPRGQCSRGQMAADRRRLPPPPGALRRGINCSSMKRWRRSCMDQIFDAAEDAFSHQN
jgi:hypothetical protein